MDLSFINMHGACFFVSCFLLFLFVSYCFCCFFVCLSFVSALSLVSVADLDLRYQSGTETVVFPEYNSNSASAIARSLKPDLNYLAPGTQYRKDMLCRNVYV